MARTSKANAQKSNTGLIALLIVVTLLIAAAAVYWFAIRSPYNDTLDPNARVGVMPGTENELQEELDAATAKSTIGFALNTTPVFPNGKSKGDIMFQNPTNTQKHTRIEIYIDETNELIYESKLIEPGSYIEYAPLKVNLAAGQYACTAYIYGYMMDTGEYVGKVAAGLTVTVET